MIRTLRGLLYFSTLVFASSLFGQTGKAGPDAPTSFVLVVPFNPQMYKNPGDHIICKANDVNPGQLNDMLRRSISSTMVANLSEHYHTKEIKSDNDKDPKSDLSLLYGAIGYKTKKRKPVGFHKGYPTFKLKQFFGPRHTRWGTNCVNKDFTKPFKKRSYVEAVIKNDSVFSQVMAGNKSSFVLLVNQFEMNTRFKSCLDLQRNVFQRDMYIHFTLLDSSGKKLHGGVVGTTFQSSSNDIEMIMEKNLGLLCGMIIDIVRKEL